MRQAFNTYRNTLADRIANSRPEELMIMLYDGMMTKIKQAKERFQAGQQIPARESLIRAMQIADALMENLNMEEGGETAMNLERLYYFIISELSNANRTDDPLPALDNALMVIQPLYEGWKSLGAKAQ